jgi:Acetyltransferase (GNAT) domain
VACCISLRKRDRLYAKYAGFDYDILGTRSGLYAPVVIWATLAAAYQTGCSAVEFGVGAHQAKIIRGCLSRPIESYLLTEDAYVREMFKQAALASRNDRGAEY